MSLSTAHRETFLLHRGRKSLLHRTHRLAVPLDHGMSGDAEAMPPPQMGEQAIRQAHCRLALLGRASTLGTTMKYAMVEINMAAPDGLVKCRTANRSVAGAGVKANQNEARDMLAYMALGDIVAHEALIRRVRRRRDSPGDAG